MIVPQVLLGQSYVKSRNLHSEFEDIGIVYFTGNALRKGLYDRRQILFRQFFFRSGMENPDQDDHYVDWKTLPTMPVRQRLYNLYYVGLGDGQFGLTHTVKELYVFLTVFQD